MYAFVDIETTGSYNSKNCITEVAIILHNGIEIEGKYNTLINPESPILSFVQTMTGITNKMVENAPTFSDVAEGIYNLLINRVFVAHNVNFDYSFIKQHLKTVGYEIDLPKICTIKLSRKIFPGLLKYGLGSLSNHFNIKNNARHRASGDAEALMELFLILQKNDINKEIEQLTKRRKEHQYLPPNINQSILNKISSLPGVYYFHNKKNKIVYVGKAINLKKRVSSHFSNNKSSKQKQNFLKEIYNITWKDCSSELTACIFESIEIKRLWPIFNKSQKHFERQYGIYEFEDSIGYKRLAIDNKRKILKPLATFSLLLDARNTLLNYCKQFDIDPWMFFLSKESSRHLPELKEYNQKIKEIITDLDKSHETYLIHDFANNYILIEHGKFYGMGVIKSLPKKRNLDDLKQKLTVYPENIIIKSYINKFINENPESIIPIK